MADLNAPGQAPPRRSLWLPAIVGGLATLVFAAGFIAPGFLYSGIGEVIAAVSGFGLTALVIAALVMLFPSSTRVWGGGLLLGFGIALGIILVVLAGLCVALLASYDQSS